MYPICRVDEEIMSRFGSMNIEQTDHEGDVEEAEASSSWIVEQVMGKSKGNSKAKNEVQDILQVPCQHHYCKMCIMRTRGQIILSPRCCGQEMPMSLLRPCITVELKINSS